MSDLLLPPHPLHLATLGLLDNEIGAATLGYIVGPPIVPRFPADAVVQEMAWLGRVDQQADWQATAQGLGWAAMLDQFFELHGELELLFSRARVEEAGELEAMVQQMADMAAAVEDSDESAEVAGDGSVGVVEDGAASATVQESVPVGIVQDVPGKGKC